MSQKADARDEDSPSMQGGAKSFPLESMMKTSGRIEPADPRLPRQDPSAGEDMPALAGRQTAAGQNRPVRILAIIVIYKMNPWQSPSFTTLRRSAELIRPGEVEIE